MLIALLPTITSIVVQTSAGIAVDSAVKMIVPFGIKALPAFAIKLGTTIAGGLIGGKIASIVSKNITEVIATVQTTDAKEVTPEKEDN